MGVADVIKRHGFNAQMRKCANGPVRAPPLAAFTVISLGFPAWPATLIPKLCKPVTFYAKEPASHEKFPSYHRIRRDPYRGTR
ncbi:hypothetical protein, partial [Sulfitobacter sp. UBA4523]|uniref:hypothetical protein n=1 Tax=Sulfitobacter sp. UBA4523 TaxID=1947584 RepID=UPI00257E64C7